MKKEAGEPAPWTDDEILQTYRFCNVRRMDDKVSRWLEDNWYKPYRDHTNMLSAVVLARNFNLPTTLRRITSCVFSTTAPKWSDIKRIVRELKDSGQTVFNGAYMVRGMSKNEKHYTSCKSDQVVDRMVEPLYKNGIRLNTSSMENAVTQLLPHWGFSTFMAGQVVADARWALTGAWADSKSWASVGPGSARGLARLVQEDDWDTMSRGFMSRPEDWLSRFRPLLGQLYKQLQPSITKRLEAHDYQNCLCEWDKYERTLWGQGKPKQLYRKRK